jgi:prepilin-type N-terminal cleavage/methylation domain-containing protein
MAKIKIAHYQTGFTLIEMSNVLVIIGLIVGAILTGQDLINAAATRAQISQIEKYQTAVRTFQIKYGYLPGDITDPTASQFGFSARGTSAGEGDGNGVIEGYIAADGNTGVAAQAVGEIAIFWADLSTANLIDAGIQSYDAKGAGYPSAYFINATPITLASTPSLYQWMPAAKIGSGIFVYILSYNNTNYFGVSTVTSFFADHDITSSANPGLTAQQAYNIDGKVDDGLPQSGSITACYVNWGPDNNLAIGAAGNQILGANGGWTAQYQRCTPTTGAVAYATTNCYDNATLATPAGVAGVVQRYSVLQNANMPNCALSFRFQ